MKQISTFLAVAVGLAGAAAFASSQISQTRLASGMQKVTADPMAKSPVKAFAAPVAPVGDVPDEPEHSDNLEEIMYEDFSLFTEGSEEQRAEDFLAGPGLWEVDPQYTHNPGWTGYGIYQAGGTCALDYPGFGGWMNTPLFDLTGKIVLRFRARPIRPEDTWHGIAVTLLRNPDSPTYADEDCFRYAQLNTPEWQEFEFVFENTCIDKCFVQFNDGVDRQEEPERLGILIDDIRILRDVDYIPAPSNAKASDFTDSSFSLSWSAAPGADSYEVNIRKEVVSDEPAITVKEDFNGFDAENPVWPEGWKPVFASSPIVEGGTDGSLGMAFRTNDDEVDFPSDGMSRVEYFACTIYPGHVNDGSEAAVYIFGHSPEWDHWGWLQQLPLVDIPAEGLRVVMTADADELWRNDAMNISFKDAAEGEYAIVDDIELLFENARSLEDAFVLTTAETSVLVEDLEPESDYYYSVCAVKDGKKSLFTQPAKAFGVAVPDVAEASDIDRRGAFTANWTAAPKATAYSLNLYKATRIEEDTEGYVVMHEDFDNPKVEVTATPEEYEWVPGYDDYLYFDDYTETPGWHSDGAAVCVGMIGCGSSSYMDFNLYSPRMTLSNDNGVFTVEAMVWSEAGETFVVQTESEYHTLTFDETGLKQFSARFETGGVQQQLMMYTLNGAPFFLDDFKVMQNVEKGDLLYDIQSEIPIEDASTSFRFSGLESNGLYAYNVKAIREYRDLYCTSDTSGMQLVDLAGSGIDNVASAVYVLKAYVSGGDIVVESAPADLVRIFNVHGVEVARVDMSASTTARINVDKGIYIVTCGDTFVKVVK